MSSDLLDQLVAELPRLGAYAWSVTGDRHRAEDLAQETLARALERRETYRHEAPLGAWLRGILHNLAIDQGRRQRETPREDVAALADAAWRDDSWTVDAAVVIERAEAADELRDALLALPFIYRSAVVLHDMEGLTVPVIASIQSISLAAAKQRLRRGRMMLVTALAELKSRALDQLPLRCWDARSQVSDYIDNELSATKRQRLEAHLARCPTCPPIYASLVGVTAALGALADEAALGPIQVQRVREALQRRREDRADA
ncbi:sigma-70 family RNA polymerase sigma factor [Nocardioides sp. NPDC000445]|uniref:sigma-70 family RNA polymerase sigma factor n=1 Tax=Nocardioides sp. NPDC000445 TaxID=3154257 RepID=UPI003322375C